MSTSHDSYVISLGNRETYIFKVSDKGVDIVLDPVTGRSLKTIIAFTNESRLFSGLAASSTCPYEGKIAYNFINKLGNKKKIVFPNYGKQEFYARELVSYYIGHICDSINPRPEEIYVVIPKWWNDYMKEDLIEAAEIAGVRIKPVMSNIAHAYSLYNKIAINENERIYIGLIDSGATGFDITFSSIMQNKITTELYNHYNFGGEDITNALATMILGKALDKYGKNKEVRTLLNEIKEKKNLSQHRIFLKEAERVKESLAPDLTIKFDPKTLKHEVIVDVSYNDFIQIKEVQHYVFQLEKQLTDFRNEFYKIYSKPIYCFDINGGNGIFALVKQICGKVFDKYKITGYLNAKEAIASGAAYYINMIKGQNEKIREYKELQEEAKSNPQAAQLLKDKQKPICFQFIDKVEPYVYSKEGNVIKQKINPNIIKGISRFVEPKSKDDTFPREASEIQYNDIAKVAQNENPKISLDEFGMLIPTKSMTMFGKTSKDELAKEKQRYKDLLKMDGEYQKLGEFLNEFQRQTIQFQNFVTNVIYNELDKQNDQQLNAINEASKIQKQFEDSYNKKNSSKSVSEIKEEMKKIYTTSTSFVVKVINMLAGKLVDISPLKPDSKEEEFVKNEQFIQTCTSSLERAIDFGNKVINCTSPNCSVFMKVGEISSLVDSFRESINKYKKISEYNNHIRPSKIAKPKIAVDHTSILSPLSAEEKKTLLTAPTA